MYPLYKYIVPTVEALYSISRDNIVRILLVRCCGLSKRFSRLVG